MKACVIRSSLSPRSSAAISSVRMRSEYWQPTWLHSSRIWPQPQTHIMWCPSDWNRASWSPAPIRARMAAERSATWAVRFNNLDLDNDNNLIPCSRGNGSDSRGHCGAHGCAIGHQRDHRSENHDQQPQPDRRYHRIQVRLDDRPPGVLVDAFVNQIKIADDQQIREVRPIIKAHLNPMVPS